MVLREFKLNKRDGTDEKNVNGCVCVREKERETEKLPLREGLLLRIKNFDGRIKDPFRTTSVVDISSLNMKRQSDIPEVEPNEFLAVNAYGDR